MTKTFPKERILLFEEIVVEAVGSLKNGEKREKRKMRIFILHPWSLVKRQTVNTNGQRDLSNVVIGFE